MKRGARALAAILFCISPAAAKDRGFDFYVLALSWSPTYCASAPDAGDSAECDAGRNRGFVAHGLWPQYEKGYPQSCGSRPLPKAVGHSVRDIMPDAGLAAHEWRKHGTCSGLSPETYFATLRKALASVRIPADLEAVAEDRRISAAALEDDFVAANPGLTSEGIAISCRGSAVEEVRICLTRALGFRACEEVDAQGCKSTRLRLPAAT